MTHIFANLLVVILLLAAPLAHAVQPDEILKDPTQEMRARNLSKEVRCMVCQNQSIDDSDAPLARDLRLLVRERIATGDTDSQVLGFLVARYGDFVLLRPRFTGVTVLLWLLPPLILSGGGVALWLIGRRRLRRSDHGCPFPLGLSEGEKARLDRLIGGRG